MTSVSLKSRPYLAWPAYGLCAFLPLSIAGISVFKLLVLLLALGVLLSALVQRRSIPSLRSYCVLATLTLLSVMALSLGYTSATEREALEALAKYSKLLLVPAMILLLRSQNEALTALKIYTLTQSFVLLSSWLLFAGLKLPWSPDDRNAIGVVYSSYLDQAILTAGFAALVWHLRAEFPGKWGAKIAIVLALLAALNLVFVLQGRSGQVCLIAAIGVSAWWAVPRRLKILAITVPFLAFGLAAMLSSQFNQRYAAVVNEIKAYQIQSQNYKDTSSGERLNFWQKSVQAISEKPLLGHGVGAWQQQYLRLENGNPSPGTAHVRNPHQEYLLTGVQLGLVGIFLLLAWQASFVWEARQFATAAQRAMLSLLAVFVVACCFNSAIYDAVVGDYFCTLLAVLWCLGRHVPNDTVTASRS
jgi:O-antigen ligase